MGTSDWTLFLGRWHPVLVHLPIGLILGLVFLELVAALRPRKAVVRAAAGPLLILLVPSALAAALCGWLLAAPGGYDAHLLRLHRVGGLVVAALTVLMAVAHVFRRSGWYRFFLVVCAVVLVPAAHYGGALTHGRDYLARYAPSWLKPLLGGTAGVAPVAATPPVSDPAEFQVYAHGIQPFFDHYCVSCHGPEKARGGLRLDHPDGWMRGGDSGPAIEPGRPDASLVLKRMRLPLDHDDHMPPPGKPQPEPMDLEVLAWWIGRGAPTNGTLAELAPPAAVAERLRTLFRPGAAGSSVRTPDSAPAEAGAAGAGAGPDPETIHARLGLSGVSVTALASGEPWLQVSAVGAGRNFDDEALARLVALCGDRIRWLDLGGTAVTDAGLRHLQAAPHLERLRLDRTRVTDAGLTELQKLVGLESLNLYGTAVTETGVAAVLTLPRLQRLYLWRTQVGPEAAVRLLARSSAGAVQTGGGPSTDPRPLQIETGPPPGAVEPVPGVPVNTICPVSDRLADPTRTLWHEDRLVAFCCEDCREAFRQDPARFSSRLAQLANPPPAALGRRPDNERCPVCDKPAMLEVTLVHRGRVLAFCSGACRERFVASPGDFAAGRGPGR
jgi:uncharacterized membrane protein/YHS domain-containing protein